MSQMSQTLQPLHAADAAPPAPLCPMARMNALPITDRLVMLAIRAWVEAVRNDLPPSAAAPGGLGAPRAGGRASPVSFRS